MRMCFILFEQINPNGVVDLKLEVDTSPPIQPPRAQFYTDTNEKGLKLNLFKISFYYLFKNN